MPVQTQRGKPSKKANKKSSTPWYHFDWSAGPQWGAQTKRDSDFDKQLNTLDKELKELDKTNPSSQIIRRRGYFAQRGIDVGGLIDKNVPPTKEERAAGVTEKWGLKKADPNASPTATIHWGDGNELKLENGKPIAKQIQEHKRNREVEQFNKTVNNFIGNFKGKQAADWGKLSNLDKLRHIAKEYGERADASQKNMAGRQGNAVDRLWRNYKQNQAMSEVQRRVELSQEARGGAGGGPASGVNISDMVTPTGYGGVQFSGPGNTPLKVKSYSGMLVRDAAKLRAREVSEQAVARALNHEQQVQKRAEEKQRADWYYHNRQEILDEREKDRLTRRIAHHERQAELQALELIDRQMALENQNMLSEPPAAAAAPTPVPPATPAEDEKKTKKTMT